MGADRRTCSASPEHWAVLEGLITDGRAENLSAALRYVIDYYTQTEAQKALTNAASSLDENDWAALSGMTREQRPSAPWSAILDDVDS